MKETELIKLANDLGIDISYQSPEFIILKGVNGASSIVYSDLGAEKGLMKKKPATHRDFFNHIIMMGKDSLRMDLSKLLSITSHS